jgi:hypothetical protein
VEAEDDDGRHDRHRDSVTGRARRHVGKLRLDAFASRVGSPTHFARIAWRIVQYNGASVWLLVHRAPGSLMGWVLRWWRGLS